MSLVAKLKERLIELGHEPNKKFGQNFLVSDYAINKIIEEVQRDEAQKICEIGPGLGALTDHLIALQKPMLVIEFDKKLIDFWTPRFKDQNVELIHCDALKFDWSQEKLLGTHLVSNLPYQISSSLVIELSEKNSPLSCMTLMFQKEVADRITAKASTGSYGLLSIVAQVFWETHRLIELSPKDFYPPPKVASSVVCFKPKSTPLDAERSMFIKFVKAAFNQRRKKLSKNLGMVQYDSKQVIEVLSDIGKSDNVRAEELTPEEFVGLYKALQN